MIVASLLSLERLNKTVEPLKSSTADYFSRRMASKTNPFLTSQVVTNKPAHAQFTRINRMFKANTLTLLADTEEQSNVFHDSIFQLSTAINKITIELL